MKVTFEPLLAEEVRMLADRHCSNIPQIVSIAIKYFKEHSDALEEGREFNPRPIMDVLIGDSLRRLS